MGPPAQSSAHTGEAGHRLYPATGFH